MDASIFRAHLLLVAIINSLLLLTAVSGQDQVAGTDPDNAAMNSCLAGNATGPITSVLGQTITGGQFTFYGDVSGPGACGTDTGKPRMSAAASGSLFKGGEPNWVKNCKGTEQTVLDDAVCIKKCVKITYTCVGCSSPKSLTVPINNKCPECAQDHVDLTTSAFNYLEPQGGTVGIAKNATITYIEC